MDPSVKHRAGAPLSFERPEDPPSDALQHGASPAHFHAGSESPGHALQPLSAPTSPSDAVTFPESSNFLARALHHAIMGSEPLAPHAPIKGDTSAVIRLLELATTREIAEANFAMRTDYKYDLTTYIDRLVGPERRSLEQSLRHKGVSLETLSCPSSGDRLRLEYLRREFEAANIFPEKIIPCSAAEKLELLDTYLDRLDRGLSRYPGMLQRLERSRGRQEELALDIQINLLQSIERGEWSSLGAGISPADVIAHAGRCTERARSLVRQLQRHPEAMTVTMLSELVTNLDVATRITPLFARDFYEEARVAFAEAKPSDFWERLWRVKPSHACETALNALFTRRYLILRAMGVSSFVSHMRHSLQMS